MTPSLLPRPKRPNLPPSPIKPLRDLIRGGRQQVEKAGKDIRSMADELHVTAEPPVESPETNPVAERAPQKETVATACVPCSLGHFSTSAGLLNEVVRFKGEGITSNEILDRVAKVQEEQNTLERVDLTEENIQSLPSWEKVLAEDALSQSRKLRHTLESFTSIEQLKQAAADTSSFYRELNRKWFKGRFAHLGPEQAERIADEVGKLSPEDKERVLKR